MAKAAIPVVATDQVVNDYKMIKGIGPAVEKRLHNVGFLSYAQLAVLTPKAVSELLNGMIGFSAERIDEEDWIGQAKKLADDLVQVTEAPVSKPEKLADDLVQVTEVPVSKPDNNSLHYASYTFEFLLNKDNKVRRTRGMHIQSRQEVSWAGWDLRKLLAFLVESGEMNDTTMTKELASHADIPPADSPLPVKQVDKRKISQPDLQLSGSARITETHLHSPEGRLLGALIPSDQPFVVHLDLDLSKLEVPRGEDLTFDASIYKRRLGDAERECIANLEGLLPRGERAVIEVKSNALIGGDYRLDAIVAIRPKSQQKDLKHQHMAISEGLLLHVF